MNKNIKKIEVDGEPIYLRKNYFLGWGVVNPLKNEDGTYNWFNIITGGNWTRFFMMIVMVCVLLGFFYERSQSIQTLLDCFNNSYTLEICKMSFMPNYP